MLPGETMLIERSQMELRHLVVESLLERGQISPLQEVHWHLFNKMNPSM